MNEFIRFRAMSAPLRFSSSENSSGPTLTSSILIPSGNRSSSRPGLTSIPLSISTYFLTLFGSENIASARSFPTFLLSTSKAATTSTSSTPYPETLSCQSPSLLSL